MKAAKRRKATTKRATTRKSAAPARRKATRAPARATRTGAKKKSTAAKAKKATRAAAKRASASKARKSAARTKAKPTRAAAKLRTTKARAKARATKVKARAAKAKATRATRAKTARAKATKPRATRAKVAKPRAAKKARAAKPRAAAGRARRAKAAKTKTSRVKATRPRLARVKATKPRLVRRKIAARSERALAPAAEPKKLRKKLRLDDQPKLKERLKLKHAGEQDAAVEAERPRRTSDKPQRASDRPQRASDRPQRTSDKPAAEKKSVRPGVAKGKGPASSIERRPGRVPLREPPRVVTLPLPMLPPPRRATIEERSAIIEQRLNAQSEDFRRRYIESLDMSWIYHDSALEGVVYTFDELRAALSGPAPLVTDSSLQPTYDDIRRHKEAIVYVREQGENKRAPITLDCMRKLYLILHPEEGDLKTVKYRKDIPQHRLYFHEYAPPDKIAYKVRQIIDWLNDPETRKTRNGIRIAARAHYDLLRVYPFPNDSGKVARLFMNMLLLRTGLPPSIIHSTERQRYYEALKGSATTVLQMVQESVENALASVEKLLDEHETRKRAFVS
ncbi:Fic family protein [Sorangium sp. So ce834]|uniref:Fic family protein n=1 Tax=Sorangium sp. So ce834 TaxID=3133321 RepID=UPI003F5EC61D